MARQERIDLIDDLDGSPAEGTFQVSWDGQAVEVELSKENRTRIEESLAALFDAGRKISVHYGSRGPQGPKPKQVRAPRSEEKANNSAIREWARENNYPVSDRGRISREVVAAYNQQNPQG